MKQAPDKAATVFTIGHSTRPLGEFVEILRAHGIALVIDIRTIPRSKHNPQYNSPDLEQSLREYGIGYRHMPGLGGLRHARKDSVNPGWENASFRGFADYMQTEDFSANVRDLIATARIRPTAIMCAEAVPWRCHRSLIGDALLVRGMTVKDIMSRSGVKDHALTPWADVSGERIIYPKSRERVRKQG